MELTIYHIDAFAEKVFKGNPAAVIVLEDWLTDDLLQSIAMENNLSETAFIVKTGSEFEIRWFTPLAEVALCGHATLASAFVLFECLHYEGTQITFISRQSGTLYVRKFGDELQLEFPADIPVPTEIIPELIHSFQVSIQELYVGKTDLLLIVKDQQEVEQLNPDFRALLAFEQRGFIVSAPGKDCDFVSRFFCPVLGIDEDPVTGSAHTTLAPYWAGRLGKNIMTAKQLSVRGGSLKIELAGDRVKISGKAVKYLEGKIYLNE